MPELRFTLEGAAPVSHAASPQLGVTVRIRASAPVQSVLLRTSVRIEAGARHYSAAETARLVELFGEPSLWTRGSRSLLWAQVTSVVSAFEGETDAIVALPCTYELTHAASKYLRALDGGHVPLRALFAGTVFS